MDRPTPTREAAGRVPVAAWAGVALAALAVVVLRLPLLHLPAWADESGYLQVGGAWRLGGHAGPHALYGPYWVDRPPVLVALYGLASSLGGLTALRLLGALAAALTVLGVAALGRSVVGPRAAAWAAAAAAALLSSPWVWAYMVDGELLAAPFVAWGLAAVAGSLRASTASRAVGTGMLAGAVGLVAVLVKQNVLDVAVFAVVLLPLAALTGSLTWRAAGARLLAVLAGAVAAGVAVAAWTVLHGTSLGGVFYAMYPFRLDAARITHGGDFSAARLGTLGIAAVITGLLLLAVWGVLAGVPRLRREPVVAALLVVLAYDVFSVLAGGNFWLHYLVQPAVPVAALAGVLIGLPQRWSALPGRLLVVLCVVSALIGWALLLQAPRQAAEETVGRAVGAVAQPGDTIVTLPGRSNVNAAAGLASSYPYLWSLPARTLDPGLRRLRASMSAGSGPTWFVAWSGVRRQGPPGSLGAVLDAHYQEVGRVCGRAVFLRDGVSRLTPEARPDAGATAASACESITRLPPLLRGLAVRLGTGS